LLDGLKKYSKIPELQKRILYTFLLLIVYRIGAHVPTPGIDTVALAAFFAQAKGSLLGLFDMFAGGALSNLSVFALGISALYQCIHYSPVADRCFSIPGKNCPKKGRTGRRKITQYTRYGTVILSIIQGFGIAVGLENMAGPTGVSIVLDPGWSFRLMTVITLTAGTGLYHVVGRTDYGKGDRQWYFADHFCRHCL